MAFDFGSAIGGIAGGVGSIIGSASSANAAKEAARISRDWEREKLQNAYQYTVKDLKAAGLNPILAVQNGPNTAGSINTPMPDYSGFSAAGAHIGEIFNRKLKNKAIEVQKTGMDSQIEKNKSDIEVNKQNVLNAKAQVENLKLQNDLIRAQLPSAQNVASYRNSDFGRAMQYVGLGLGDIAPALGPISYSVGGYFGSKAGTAAALGRMRQQGQAVKKMSEKTQKISGNRELFREMMINQPTYYRGIMRY